jgi:hypothetical protein
VSEPGFLLCEEAGVPRLLVRLEEDTVWLTQGQMADLFQTTKQNVSLHIRNVFAEGELDAAAVVKEYLTTATDGKRYQVAYYNLDVIISVGYRVRSHVGTRFRIWATQRLREYLVKGFALDDRRLKAAPPDTGQPSSSVTNSTGGRWEITPASWPRWRKRRMLRRPASPMSRVQSFTYIPTN